MIARHEFQIIPISATAAKLHEATCKFKFSVLFKGKRNSFEPKRLVEDKKANEFNEFPEGRNIENIFNFSINQVKLTAVFY